MIARLSLEQAHEVAAKSTSESDLARLQRDLRVANKTIEDKESMVRMYRVRIEKAETAASTANEKNRLCDTQIDSLNKQIATIKAEVDAKDKEVAAWRAACKDVMDAQREVVKEVKEISKALFEAFRSRVRSNEETIGAIRFMNWTLRRYFVVGDALDLVKFWQDDQPFLGTLNVIGQAPPAPSCVEIPDPSLTDDTDDAERAVAYCRSRRDERSLAWDDPDASDIELDLAKDAIDANDSSDIELISSSNYAERKEGGSVEGDEAVQEPANLANPHKR
ncbi:hypothetical protein AeRB84_015261 [Aphanomyces euteiches]|nr:hypothetical protein AeRB84_015261 [Aphanomyces euteiches]